MSVAADPPGRAELPPGWARLERVAEDAAMAVSFWKRRALEAEEEVLRLRRSLEELAATQEQPDSLEEEVRRLRAENAALQSRMLQARKRVGGLMKRLSTLELEP
jgi:predicted nuclease with TOPRIM domain